MSRNGAGTQRILVLDTAEQPQPHASDPPLEREVHPRRELPVKKPAMQQTGWTPRRLTIAGALGVGATLLGGVVFISKFGVLGGADSPLLAMGFGLFVIGMIVFCAALIALLGLGISILGERGGSPAAAAAVFAPLALIWALYGLGAVGYAIPAVISLVLIAGLVVALK